jgi:hypothetical protein
VGGDLRGELREVPPDSVDRHDVVAGKQDPGGGRAALHGPHPGGLRVQDPVGVHEPPEQDEGDQDVDGRARGDHGDPLPHGLAEVGPVGHLGRDLLERAHPGDLHVAPERDRPDRVLGLAALRARQQRREEQAEALHAHADELGHGEVAELVQDDQRREAQEGEKPAHRTSRLGIGG